MERFPSETVRMMGGLNRFGFKYQELNILRHDVESKLAMF